MAAPGDHRREVGALESPAELSAPNYHSAELFQRAYGEREPNAYRWLLNMIIHHGEPGPVLDLGAGLGLFVELASRWGLDVTGLEGSAYAVAQAKARIPALRMEEHDLGAPLPFPDGSFSNVVLNQVVEHIDGGRLRVTLDECRRVLAARGKLFILSPSRLNFKERREPSHINMMLPSELRRAVTTAGFRVASEPNRGLWFVPGAEGRTVEILSRALLRVIPADWISASANVVAERRDR